MFAIQEPGQLAVVLLMCDSSLAVERDTAFVVSVPHS